MPYGTEWNDEPTVKPKFTDAQIEEQQRLFTACLKDGKGNIHEITVPLCIWDWFLIITHSGTSLTGALDHVQVWRKRRRSKDDINSLFAMFISELIRMADEQDALSSDSLDYNHLRVQTYLEAESHSRYDELQDLQWRIDGKKTYPIIPPPFPNNPDILCE